jgi:GDP-L-fucose synthase
LSKVFEGSEKYEVISSTREDTNLFSFEETKKKIDDLNPSIIINAAARVGGIYANNTKRTQFILENLKINMNILESIIENNKIKFINLGSSCIYPLNAENPIKESSFMDGKLEPTNSPYAMAKLSAIEIGRSISFQYGHKIVNLMPTNLYGPNDFFSENDSHVIPGLIHRMHSAMKNNHEEFSIWGSGEPLREFLYVEDLANAVLHTVENDIEGDLINIGSGEEISINNLGSLIKDIIGYKGKIIYDSSKPDGNPRKLLDSTLINDSGWRSSTPLKEGLSKTYDWFVNNKM